MHPGQRFQSLMRLCPKFSRRGYAEFRRLRKNLFSGQPF
ncbi:hypothetical protein roselon_02964 [Roseibacterium elongatum DSM 19469]|uniref:Uncharacterized protein n=1 Tax=Roseicyclus elongatus DSM 19469 TaxID=1294273 RepID=W8RVL1_9RHOB|nr:hypothetical protein roselon_02964 [Roseibacterium elongatum DSM 19469]